MLYVFACVSPTPLPQTDICTDLQARSHGTDNHPPHDTLVLIIFILLLVFSTLSSGTCKPDKHLKVTGPRPFLAGILFHYSADIS